MFSIDIKEIFSVTLVLFSVIDILGSIPIIVSFRAKYGSIQSGKITIASGIIMISFLFVGHNILQLFGVDESSFAIAGSLLIFLFGIEMVLGIEIFKHHSDGKEDGVSNGIIPIAFPLIGGAGTITALLSLRAEYHIINIIIGIFINLLIVFITLKSTGFLEKKLGKQGINAMRKVFGIILISIAIKLFKNYMN
ncbi:MAG: MarC family protein [Chitinophagaceae bacterium]|nr:MarC family protein [Chitinophagaceae bacterium]